MVRNFTDGVHTMGNTPTFFLKRADVVSLRRASKPAVLIIPSTYAHSKRRNEVNDHELQK